MSFKDVVRDDCKNVFLNADEFAECHTIWYDGDVFHNIPVVLTKLKESRRPTASENMEGIHLVTAVMHVALEDMDGIIPEQKQRIEIDDGVAMSSVYRHRYTIVTSDCEMGMIVLELEAYDE